VLCFDEFVALLAKVFGALFQQLFGDVGAFFEEALE
jgi:hypothetical protein